MKKSQRQCDLLSLEAVWEQAGLPSGVEAVQRDLLVVGNGVYKLAVDTVARTAQIVEPATGRPAVDPADAEQFLAQAQQVTQQAQDSLEPESWQSVSS